MNTQPTPAIDDIMALMLLLTKEERIALYDAVQEKASARVRGNGRKNKGENIMSMSYNDFNQIFAAIHSGEIRQIRETPIEERLKEIESAGNEYRTRVARHDAEQFSICKSFGIANGFQQDAAAGYSRMLTKEVLRIRLIARGISEKNAQEYINRLSL